MSTDLVPTTGPPAAADWDVVQQQAEVLSRSNIVPSAYRGKPADIMVAILWGHDLGLGPIPALKFIDVIEGEPALNTEARIALIRKAGHSISGSTSATKAVITGKRADTGDEMTVEWTIEMAQRAKYKTGDTWKPLAEKNTWKSYPEAMLWARAASQLGRMLFADVTLGLSYSPEEVRDWQDGTPPPEAPTTADDGIEDAEIVDDGPPAGVDPETGEVDDVPDLELRMERLSEDQAKGMVAWRKEKRFPQMASMTPAQRRAVDAELDRRGWALRDAEPDPGAEPEKGDDDVFG